MIHSYLLKKLFPLCGHLAAQMNLLLKDGTKPGWLTQGQIFLNIINAQKGTIISKYWLITSLSRTWTLLSGVTAAIEVMCRHVAQYMSRSHKGVGSDTGGAKHQLCRDTADSRH